MTQKDGCPQGKKKYGNKCVDAKMLTVYREKQKQSIDPIFPRISELSNWSETVGLNIVHDNLEKAIDLLDM